MRVVVRQRFYCSSKELLSQLNGELVLGSTSLGKFTDTLSTVRHRWISLRVITRGGIFHGGSCPGIIIWG